MFMFEISLQFSFLNLSLFWYQDYILLICWFCKTILWKFYVKRKLSIPWIVKTECKTFWVWCALYRKITKLNVLNGYRNVQILLQFEEFILPKVFVHFVQVFKFIGLNLLIMFELMIFFIYVTSMRSMIH